MTFLLLGHGLVTSSGGHRIGIMGALDALNLLEIVVHLEIANQRCFKILLLSREQETTEERIDDIMSNVK